MAYATQQDVIDRYGEEELLTASDRDNDGNIDTVAVSRALDDASAEIDSYLVERYTLPLAAPVPARLVEICGAIAVYKLSNASGPNTEEKRLRYEDALKWLSKVALGEVGLGDAGAEGSADTPSVSMTAQPRLFTRDTQGGL